MKNMSKILVLDGDIRMFVKDNGELAFIKQVKNRECLVIRSLAINPVFLRRCVTADVDIMEALSESDAGEGVAPRLHNILPCSSDMEDQARIFLYPEEGEHLDLSVVCAEEIHSLVVLNKMKRNQVIYEWLVANFSHSDELFYAVPSSGRLLLNFLSNQLKGLELHALDLYVRYLYDSLTRKNMYSARFPYTDNVLGKEEGKIGYTAFVSMLELGRCLYDKGREELRKPYKVK